MVFNAYLKNKTLVNVPGNKRPRKTSAYWANDNAVSKSNPTKDVSEQSTGHTIARRLIEAGLERSHFWLQFKENKVWILSTLSH